MRFALLVFICTCRVVLGQVGQNITIGQRDSLFSNILKEGREILVHVPEPQNPDVQSATYPVLYLLDGDKLFTQTIGILDHLSGDYGGEKCPKMIVVGIVSTNRTKDLLPVTSRDAKDNDDDFTRFLEKELIPYIDKKYPTQPFRTFLGHSLGGLRVANTLLYNPSVFSAYIALDPSLGHDMNLWSAKAHQLTIGKQFRNKSLYLAMAQTMSKGMDTSTIRRDSTGESRHMRAIMQFANDLKSNTSIRLAGWKYFPNLSHGAVSFTGTYEGLTSVFSFYQNADKNRVYEATVHLEEALELISGKFKTISAQMGYTVLPPEEYILEMAEILSAKGQKQKAIGFARLNLENYPKSELAQYHLRELEKK